ncbi:MAG: diguanylate cyclase, partial [Kangiellaceae bacterium]|nr:diguanylate cyclase [Kangiellaceae bacterium]
GFWLDSCDDVDEVLINGHILGKTGHFPPHFQSGFRYKRLYLIPYIFLNFNEFNHLEIRTFSSANQPGLNSRSIILGNYFDFSYRLQEHDYIYIFCISTLLILAILQFLYFLLVKDGDEILYLALFLLSFAVVSFTRSQAPLHIGLDLSATFKAEMFMLNVGVIGMTLFIFRFHNLRIRKIYLQGIFIMSIPNIVNIIHPNPLVARYVSEIGYWSLCIGIFLIAGSALYLSLVKRKKYHKIVSIIGVLCWIMMCFDSFAQATIFLDLNYDLDPSYLMLTAAFLGLSMTLIITHKYWQKFKGATYDQLTGTLLRPAFFQRLSQEIERSHKEQSQLLIAIIHIQDLKNISVNYGKEISNKLLNAVSRKITLYLDPFDLICYFENGEFCISTSIESSQDAENKLKELCDLLVETQQILNEDTKFYLGVKLGGVIYSQEQHLSVSQLLQDANYGLEKAKIQKQDDFLLLHYPSTA